MTVQHALAFLRAARDDEALRRELQRLAPDAPLDDLVAIGRSAGFAVTGEELQRAYVHDWRMRWALYRDV